MNLFHAMTSGFPAVVQRGKLFGVVIGVVTNNQDPDNQGRIKVKYPWLADNEESHWARLAVPMAGKDRGFFFLPDVGDEVLLVFEQGDVSRPYILGALWNGVDLPPTDDGDGTERKLLKSKSGHIVRLDDAGGQEKIEIIDKTGKNKIIVDAANNTISISTDKDIELKAPQGKIRLEAMELEVTSSGNAKVEASGNMTIKGAMVNIN